MKTWVHQHQKGKPFLILTKQEMMAWQWHQLDYMQVNGISIQTDNHVSTLSLKQTKAKQNISKSS